MSTTQPAAAPAIPLRTRIIALIAMPLFFLTAFSLTYVSALHKPTPHDFALTIAGPAALTQQVAESIEKQAAGAFDITRVVSLTSAQHAVEDRTSDGAILIDGTTVTSVVASGGGRVATGVVQTVGAQVAQSLGGTSTVVDVAPVTAGDSTGTSLFYFLVACTVAAFLAITQLSQVIARPRIRSMLAVNVGIAIVVPIVSFSILMAVVGDFGATFGSTAAVIGIGMLTSLACGLLATALTRLLGVGAIFVEILLLVAFNFPSAGGSVPGSMLPPFWQGLHSFWIGSGALEAMRSILYFSGAQAGRWLLQLGVWAVVIAAATTLVGVRTRRRTPTPETASETAVSQAAEQAAGAAAVGSA